jgi:hypothetical protein
MQFGNGARLAPALAMPREELGLGLCHQRETEILERHAVKGESGTRRRPRIRFERRLIALSQPQS